MALFGAVLKVLVALAMPLLLAWGVARALPPPAAQRDAMARLSAPWDAPGSDAFDALFLVEYAVPADRRRALVDADLAATDGGTRAGAAAARAGMPRLVPADFDGDALCGRDDDCIARVAADRDAVAAKLAGLDGLLRNLADLRRHGHARSRLTRIDQPLPNYGRVFAGVTAHAWRFVDGDREAAMAGTCADISLWRRMAANSDSLVGTLVAAAAVERHGALLAGMFARTAPGQALPQACVAALAAPVPAEGTIGRAMVGEMHYQALIESEMAGHGVAAVLLFDAEATRLRSAMNLAAFSTPAVLADLAADRPVRPQARPTAGWGDWRCIGNLAGCVAADLVGSGGYRDYALRLQDHRARLQLLAALAWLRAQPVSGEPLAARLARWPGQWPAPARQVQASADGRALRIPLFYRGRGDAWSVPAPGSMVGADAAADAPPAPPAADAPPAPGDAAAAASRLRRT